MPNQTMGNNCFDIYLTRLLNYLDKCQNDEPFTMKMLQKDNRYWMRQDDSGYNVISFVYDTPHTCYEDINNKGYERVQINGERILKHRLIYKMFGYIPDDINFDDMEIHHINGDITDNRLSNLYLISAPNHRILHKFIDKYGLENIEL